MGRSVDKGKIGRGIVLGELPDKKRMYITRKTENEKERLIRLDRYEKALEVYKKVANEKLHDHYSIREDFDSSSYTMYEIEKSFQCIWGSEKSPTPKGIFSVESKSTDEYISGYYPEHDKVKFFGYLVIFEDYFIHSDLYEGNVSEADMRAGKAEPITARKGRKTEVHTGDQR